MWHSVNIIRTTTSSNSLHSGFWGVGESCYSVHLFHSSSWLFHLLIHPQTLFPPMFHISELCFVSCFCFTLHFHPSCSISDPWSPTWYMPDSCYPDMSSFDIYTFWTSCTVCSSVWNWHGLSLKLLVRTSKPMSEIWGQWMSGGTAHKLKPSPHRTSGTSVWSRSPSQLITVTILHTYAPAALDRAFWNGLDWSRLFRTLGAPIFLSDRPSMRYMWHVPWLGIRHSFYMFKSFRPLCSIFRTSLLIYFLCPTLMLSRSTLIVYYLYLLFSISSYAFCKCVLHLLLHHAPTGAWYYIDTSLGSMNHMCI